MPRGALVEGRGQVWALSIGMLSSSFQIASPTGVELTDQSKMACERASGILLFPPPQHWNYKTALPYSAFCLGAEAETQVFMLAERFTA